MKINIYYGGRGLLDDPTLYVINKMEAVLAELNVEVERFNLYELKSSITTLPQTLKSADGIIMATTIEWHGIGGYMQQFLDACWLYGDKERISRTYMMPVVMSTTYGEREGKMDLAIAWEILGGRPCSGLCGYIEDTISLELNQEYIYIIEKKAESFYRNINQKVVSFPASNQAIKQKISITQNIDLTPQETEQLSQYASDESYVQRQKEDIQELASLFKDMIGGKEPEDVVSLPKELEKHFHPQPGVRAVYKFIIDTRKKPLIVHIDLAEIKCEFGTADKADVEMQVSEEILNDIIYGRMTFQRAFMGGNMKMKGDFKLLRDLDQLFAFKQSEE